MKIREIVYEKTKFMKFVYWPKNFSKINDLLRKEKISFCSQLNENLKTQILNSGPKYVKKTDVSKMYGLYIFNKIYF